MWNFCDEIQGIDALRRPQKYMPMPSTSPLLEEDNALHPTRSILWLVPVAAKVSAVHPRVPLVKGTFELCAGSSGPQLGNHITDPPLVGYPLRERRLPCSSRSCGHGLPDAVVLHGISMSGTARVGRPTTKHDGPVGQTNLMVCPIERAARSAELQKDRTDTSVGLFMFRRTLTAEQ